MKGNHSQWQQCNCTCWWDTMLRVSWICTNYEFSELLYLLGLQLLQETEQNYTEYSKVTTEVPYHQLSWRTKMQLPVCDGEFLSSWTSVKSPNLVTWGSIFNLSKDPDIRFRKPLNTMYNFMISCNSQGSSSTGGKVIEYYSRNTIYQ
jgi:hypothetical protein